MGGVIYDTLNGFSISKAVGDRAGRIPRGLIVRLWLCAVRSLTRTVAQAAPD